MDDVDNDENDNDRIGRVDASIQEYQWYQRDEAWNTDRDDNDNDSYDNTDTDHNHVDDVDNGDDDNHNDRVGRLDVDVQKYQWYKRDEAWNTDKKNKIDYMDDQNNNDVDK